MKKFALIAAVFIMPLRLNAAPDISLEAAVDYKNPFVMQPIIYTVRLSHPSTLYIQGTSHPPESPDFSIIKIGDISKHTEMRENREYSVQELRFSVIFKNPGYFEIPPFRYKGQYDETSIGYFKEINLESPSVQVRVEPPVKGAGNWFPANRIDFKYAYLPRSDQVRVGDLVRWVAVIKSWYLPGELIPDIVLPQIPGVRMYDAQHEISNSNEKDGIIGEKKITINMVPEKTGTLVIPQVNLDWYDVASQMPRQMAIPRYVFKVLPALPQKQKEILSQGAINSAPDAKRFWLYVRSLTDWRAILIAVGSAALFLVCVWIRYKYWHKLGIGSRQRRQTAFKKLLTNCAAGNAKATAKCLIDYCMLSGGRKATNIRQIGEEYPALKNETALLDTALYSKSVGKWNGLRLKNLLEKPDTFEKKIPIYKDIPPLYPKG